MKKFILGYIFGILLTIIANFCWLIKDNGTISDIGQWYIYHFTSGNYIIFPLTGRCSDENRGNGQKMYEYFQCDKFQQLINLR